LLCRVSERRRRALTLRLLSLSPQYFYDSDFEAEHERNIRTRKEIVEHLIWPLVSAQDRVIQVRTRLREMPIAAAMCACRQPA